MFSSAGHTTSAPPRPMQHSREKLIFAAEALFTDLGSDNTPSVLLSHFSQIHPVIIQHTPADCAHPYRSRLVGLNAVRSYFDLLATHWRRSETRVQSIDANPEQGQVIVHASVRWTWKASGYSWVEDLNCTLDYDENVKVTSFIVRTTSGPETCVMQATDPEPKTDPFGVSCYPQAPPQPPSDSLG